MGSIGKHEEKWHKQLSALWEDWTPLCTISWHGIVSPSNAGDVAADWPNIEHFAGRQSALAQSGCEMSRLKLDMVSQAGQLSEPCCFQLNTSNIAILTKAAQRVRDRNISQLHRNRAKTVPQP